MADEESKDAAPAGKSPIVLILLTAIVAAAVGAGVSFAMLQRAAPPAEGEGEVTEEAAAAAAEEEAKAAAEEFKARLLALEPLIVNINGDGYARLLKLRVELECDTAATRQEAEARVPQIRDSLLTLVSSKRLADVTGFEGKTLLKADFQDRVNQVLENGKVDSVLFTEFVVQ